MKKHSSVFLTIISLAILLTSMTGGVFAQSPLDEGIVTYDTSCGPYTWSANGVLYNTSGVYTYAYTNALGHASVDTLRLTVKPLPSVSIVDCDADTNFCLGVNAVFRATGAASYTWKTSMNPSITLSTVDSLKLTIQETMDVFVTGTGENGCQLTDSLRVWAWNRPDVRIEIAGNGGTDQICAGDTLTLTARSNGANNFTWNNGMTTQSIIVTAAGDYTVTAGLYGCQNIHTVHLVPVTLPEITVSADHDSICAGSTITLYADPGTNTNYQLDYAWKFVSVTESGENIAGTASTFTHTPTSNTIYGVRYNLHNHNCFGVASKTIWVNTPPTLRIMGDSVAFDNCEAVLSAFPSGYPYVNFTWYKGNTQISTGHSTIYDRPTRDSHSYYLEAVTEDGCKSSVRKDIVVKGNGYAFQKDICGYKYEWRGNTYEASGVYVDETGVCDEYNCCSYDTLKLTLKPDRGRMLPPVNEMFGYTHTWTNDRGEILEIENFSRLGTNEYYSPEYVLENGCPTRDTLVLTLSELALPCELSARTIHDVSCHGTGKDGAARVVIGSQSLMDDAIIRWYDYGVGAYISDVANVEYMKAGLYNVTVSSRKCPGVVYLDTNILIKSCQEHDPSHPKRRRFSASITSSMEIYPQACDELPEVEYIITATGGTPPYNFGAGYGPGDSRTIRIKPQAGHYKYTHNITDAEGNTATVGIDGYAKVQTCAHDPNEIMGPPGYSEEKRYVNASDKMNYKIDFENDPDFALAPASRVKVTYDVPADQNISTFHLGDFGFGDFVFTVPSNASSYYRRLDVSDSLGVWVDVTAGMDVMNNQLFWVFQSIDPATGAEPVSSQRGFLSINDSLGHGEGYVSFTISPKNNVASGDTVAAKALIVFDDNETIPTNVWTNTFDAVAPSSTLMAEMDESDSLYCTFTFDAQDDANGSGVKMVEVFMSANNAPYQSIGMAHPDSSFSYILESGVHYQFMSLATDNVGNQEALKAKADTVINFNTAPYDLMLSGTTFYEYDPVNTLIGTLSTLDDDMDQSYVYTLVSGEGDDNNALFTIDGDKLKTNSNFVCSNLSDYYVRVRSTDFTGLYCERYFKLKEIIQHVTPTVYVPVKICSGESINFHDTLLSDAGTYTKVLKTPEGCDSIVTWVVSVGQHSYGIDERVACESFTWINDSTYTESTTTPTFTLTNAAGCDSVVTLHLTINHPIVGIDEQVACETFTWINDSTYTESTTIPIYTIVGGAANGCDSIVTLHLTINQSTTGFDEQVACESFTWINDSTYTESTTTPTYTIVGGAANGCDSVVTLHLTINQSTTGIDEQVACENFTWINDSTYTESTTAPTITLTNAAGCDSIVTLHLTVNYGTHNVLDTTVCESFTWIDGTGETYTTSGTYTHPYTNNSGCASVDTLYLTINYGTHNVLDTTVCESYTWTGGTGETYTTSGTYTHPYTNNSGCASVDTLYLTVNYGTHNVLDTTVYDDYEWHGVVYTVSNTYTYEYTNANGCASVDTLHLTVFHDTYQVYDTTVCESYEWHGIVYTASGTYTYEYINTNSNHVIVDTLYLTVNYGIHNAYDTVVCDSYEWHGTTYTTSGTYIYTYENLNANGCANVDTLHLTVNYSTHNVLDTTVCESYTWADGTGETYTTSGTYTHAYTNNNGCASVDTLHLTVNYGTHNVYDTVVCESYVWNGETYTQTGTYTYAYTNNGGCASVDTLHLTVNYGTHNIYDTVVCESYVWNGETYTQTGTYTYAYTNNSGCASVDTLHLTVNYGTHNVYDTVVCESYVWNGETYTQTGTYTYAYTNNSGCASVDTLHLTVNYGTHNVYDTVVCESYVWNGETYTKTGTYTYVYTNNSGCASVDTLHLTVNYGTHDIYDTVVCESYVWNGETYTQTGTYTYAYTNNSGCASVDTLHLTVNYGTHNVYDTTVCEVYEWHGNTYTISDTYTYEYTNADGCTSVDTLHLTVNYGTHNEFDTVVCDSYEWHGTTYTTSGTYIYTYEEANSDGCGNADILHLTVNYGTHNAYDTVVCESYVWNGETYTQTGTYTYEYTNNSGCASVDTLHLTVNYGTHNAFDTTVCESYVWNGETYTQTGTYTYEYTNNSGCSSVDTLHLTVNYGTHNAYDTVVCESYEWNGVTYNQTGTYTYEYTNNSGCTSVDTLHLTVNYGTHNVYDTTVCESYVWNGETYTQTGTYTYEYTNNSGCSSVDTLHLTVNYGTHNAFDTVVCESYVWNGETYTQTGTYTYEYTNNSGCTSVDTLHLTVNYGTHNAFDTVVCESYEWNGVTYNQTGTYTYEYTNNSGCSSVDTLHLTVNYGTHNAFDTVVCESYEWNGVTYNQTGTYTYAYTNNSGCASVDTLHLTVNYGTHNAYDTVVCESYEWNGVTYNQTGTYTYEYTNNSGCASVDTLHLTVNYGIHNSYDTVVCESYVWNGETYTQTGTYTYEYTNNSGCASVDTLHLTVNYGIHNAYDTTVCESYVWNGETYTQTGTYTYEYTNNSGCASVDTLHLTVNYGIHNAYDTTVCESYVWNGETYTQTGTYTYEYTNNSGCASVDTLHLTVNYGTHNAYDTTVCESYVWNGETYTQTGTYTYTYTNNNGCASVDTLHLTVNYGTHNSYDTVVCESYVWNGETYNQTGVYTYDYTNNDGCASVDTLHLTVNYGTHNAYDTVVCESYVWNGEIYTQTGTYTYEYTNNDGCVSVDTLHLTIHYGTHNVLDTTVCESYTWVAGTGETYTVSDTYTHDYINEYGCASVDTLHLTVHYGTHNSYDTVVCESYVWNGETYNQTGVYTYDYTNNDGCASVDTLHLTVNYGTHNVYDTVVCESYVWNGEIYTQTGTYTYEYTNNEGCTSVDTLHLTVHYGTHNVLDTTVCESYTWVAGTGETYTVSDTYTHEYTNEYGCASVDTLHLTVNQPTTGIDEQVACDSFTWINDSTYTESTTMPTFTIVGGAANGCDSIVTLHLAINHPTTGIDVQEACESFTWINGITYTESTTTPTYTYVGGAANGCDSTVTLHLTVNHPAMGIDERVACGSFTWINDSTYTESTTTPTYTYAGGAANGCDSIVTLHLTINQPTTGIDEQVACESYTWIDDVTYTASTNTPTYTIEGGAANGCDSTVTLHLTINQSTMGVDYQEACDSLQWIDGVTYYESTSDVNAPTFTLTNAAGCDSVVTLNLSLNHSVTVDYYLTISDDDLPFTYGDTTFLPGTVQSGDYTIVLETADGCDSVVTLHLTVTGINDYLMNVEMNVYPNPTNDKVNVQLSVNNAVLTSKAEIQLYDMYGKWLKTWKVTGETTVIDLSSYAASVYFVKAVDGQRMIGIRKVVKE